MGSLLGASGLMESNVSNAGRTEQCAFQTFILIADALQTNAWGAEQVTLSFNPPSPRMLGLLLSGHVAFCVCGAGI